MQKKRKESPQAPFYSLNISCRMLNQLFYELLLREYSLITHIFCTIYFAKSAFKNAITIGAFNRWNKIQHQFSNQSLKTYSPTKIKSLLFKKCI